MAKDDQVYNYCGACGYKLKPGAGVCPACLTTFDGQSVQRKDYEKNAPLTYRLLSAFLDLNAVSVIFIFTYNVVPILIGSVDWLLLYKMLLFTQENPELYVLGVSCAYFLIPEMIWSTTPAKRMCSLLVRTRSGTRIHPLQAIPRHLVRLGVIYLLAMTGVSWFAACVFLLYYGTMALSRKSGTLGDLLSGTIVVSDG